MVDRAMRITIVSQYFWPEAFFINEVAYQFVERGHQVAILTGLPNYPSGSLAPGYSLAGPYFERHCDIEIVRAPVLTRGRSNVFGLGRSAVSFAIVASLRARWSRRLAQPDAVLSFLASPLTAVQPAIALARRFQSPLILWVQDLWPESLTVLGFEPGSLPWRFGDGLARKAYANATAIMIASEAFRPSVESRLARPKPIIHVPNLVMGDTTSPTPVISVSSVPFRIVYGGNIGEAQGFETLIAAAEETRDEPILWTVVGDGRRMAWLGNEVKCRGLSRVELLPRQSQQDARTMFLAANALLVMLRATPAFALTVPSKLQTYLSCGRPILGSIAGETARIVTEAGAGLVAHPEDGPALAAVARRLAALPVDTRATMGFAARALFERNYSTETVIDRIEGVLRDFRNA